MYKHLFVKIVQGYKLITSFYHKMSISNIVPFYHEYSSSELHAVDLILLSNIIGALFAIPLTFIQRNILITFIVSCCMFFSSLYHSHKENSHLLQRLDSFFAFLCLSIHIVDTFLYFYILSWRFLIQSILWSLTLFSFLNAIKNDNYYRNPEKSRSSDYIFWHSIFHCLATLSYIHPLL